MTKHHRKSHHDKTYSIKKKKKNINEKHRLLQYRTGMLNLMKGCLLPRIEKHTKECLEKTMNKPILASIFPLKDSVKVRVSVGSHLEVCRGDKRVYHPSLTMNVDVPVGSCLLFYRDLTVHSGGPSNPSEDKCTRLFTVYAPTDTSVFYEKKNSPRNVEPCCGGEKNCEKCKLVNEFKQKMGGRLFINLEDTLPETKIGALIYDYDLEDHGFCILNVFNPKKTKKGIVNSIEKLEDEGSKIKFTKMGQEEDTKKYKGKRMMADIGMALNIEQKLKENINGDTDTFIQTNNSVIEEWLKKKFNVKYVKKVMTILTNRGKVGYQNLHLDYFSRCNCGDEK